MDIDLLKTFLEVEKTRHFGRAANNLYLTQSAVSARIRLLEETLGVTLFIRHRNNIQLTKKGERLVGQVAQRQVKHLLTDAIDGIVAVNELKRFKVPLIWRMHDMWTICGSQHYQVDDEIVGADAPHWTGNSLQRAIENRIFEHKRQIYGRVRQLTFCSPLRSSTWRARCAS